MDRKLLWTVFHPNESYAATATKTWLFSPCLVSLACFKDATMVIDHWRLLLWLATMPVFTYFTTSLSLSLSFSFVFSFSLFLLLSLFLSFSDLLYFLMHMFWINSSLESCASYTNPSRSVAFLQSAYMLACDFLLLRKVRSFGMEVSPMVHVHTRCTLSSRTASFHAFCSAF